MAMREPSLLSAGDADSAPEFLWKDGERTLCRQGCLAARGTQGTVLMILPTTERPPPATLDRLAHEYGLRDELDGQWAVRPLELVTEAGRTMLVLEDPGGEPLERLLGGPMKLDSFLRLAIDITTALGKLHERGLVHKDLKPAHVMVNCADGRVRLTGFGLTSRLPRERQVPAPPDFIAGTLAYMAPEQTGRISRSVDSRSDLYALGITFYQMLIGRLPFAASDAMELVHCHLARRPVPPAELRPDIPPPISAILMKLLAKASEERYQTATGVERDLRRCLSIWEAGRRIDEFPLAQHDTPDRLLIPEKLYGRTRELETLLAAFDRVAKTGATELLLITGDPGIGKSALVDELQKIPVGRNGLFASGKFDQYKRDIPYSTLVQAFQNLVRTLLSLNDAELATWRAALIGALARDAQLVTDLIPELILIIGKPPLVSELPSKQAQRRFQLAFRRFIGVFAGPERPLVLFLDDLQWLDAATLDLLEDLSAGSDLQHLLLIGAYRDSEVDASHPLARRLETIRKGEARISEIALEPLSANDLEQLIADALRSEPDSVALLAQMVHRKTAGNPFFATQFISTLAEEGLLTFSHGAACWSWDLNRIHEKGYTDNVIDLMVAKMTRLPRETQAALQHLACLGSIAGNAMLAVVLQWSQEQAQDALWPAIRLGLVERLEDAYRFAHDRVQEAAYSLIRPEQRAEFHLLVGRLLLAQTPPEQREEVIFEIVNHLDRGAHLIPSGDERDELAELNLIAGRRAKASTAYASALSYLSAGAALLAEDRWERRHELIFALELHRAECEFLTGEMAAAEQRLAGLSVRVGNTPDRATVASLRMDLHLTSGQTARAVEVGLDYLRRLGIDWSPHPTDEEARAEYERMWSRLGDRAIEDLIDMPFVADSTCLATLEVLTRIFSPAAISDANLMALVACRAVSLSLEYGNCDASCAHYAWLGRVVGGRFGDYRAAYRFGRLACDLVDRRGLSRFEAPVYIAVASNVIPWVQHVRNGRNLLRRAFDAAGRTGNLVYEAYSLVHLNANMLMAGDPLAATQRAVEASLHSVRKMKFRFVADVIMAQLGYIRTLRGRTRAFGSFDDEQYEENAAEYVFTGNPDLAALEGAYWIRKMQARFLAGDYATAINARSKAERQVWALPTELATAEFHFYGALALATCCPSAAATETDHVDGIHAHHSQLRAWERNCPPNFEHRSALVGAEIARIEARDAEAMRLYEHAIRAAGTNGFVHHEAIACELAGRFYESRGFEKIAHMYLRDARYCYLRWGADAKVRQLEQRYPQLAGEQSVAGQTSTIGALVEQLDLATVIKVSQAISGEIELEKMLDRLMRTAIEHAGAERGLLVLSSPGNRQRVAAEATVSEGQLTVRLADEPVSADSLPETILQYVIRTAESVDLSQAAGLHPFVTDPYLRQRGARSVLCLPMITQAKLVGALYLENNLTSRVFTPGCIGVLKLLTSQAAIALENARLYRDLAEREAKIRRLVDADVIGVIFWDLSGQIMEANDAFLRMVGYDREDLLAGRIRWTDLTAPEWRERDKIRIEKYKSSGQFLPSEKAYIRKDGSRIPVLISAASFEPGGERGVSFVLDLTQRKRAEAEARENERRCCEVQNELEHANRVATMGQLTASIAHEVKQPIAATVTNAQAALRFLAAPAVNLNELREILFDIVKDGNRAGEIINRIRDHMKKAPPRRDRLDINEAIREVIELTRVEAAKNRVLVRTELADGLPLVRGDRVELQQVVLNLVVNALDAMSIMREGTRELLISTAPDERSAQVSVRDSGPGLPASGLDQLFAAFYTTKPGGLGLGLSICRSIIEAHGGRLTARASMPCGAVFEFTVPAAEE